DKSLRLWDVAGGNELRALAGHRGVVTATAFSPDGKRIVSGGTDRLGKVWDTSTGKELLSLSGHRSAVSAGAFPPHGPQTGLGRPRCRAQSLGHQIGQRDAYPP